MKRKVIPNHLCFSQISGVTEVLQYHSNSSKVGRKKIVEWTIDLLYSGVLPEEGLSFSMPSHQKLPYRAVPPDEDDDDDEQEL